MLIGSIIVLVGLFVINIVFGMYYGFGFRHYWFFEILHFLGGFFMAMFLANFIDSKILIFIGIATVSFFWEITEYFIGKNPKLSYGFKKTFDLKRGTNLQPKWQDTFLDIILNFGGAIIFVYFIS